MSHSSSGEQADGGPDQDGTLVLLAGELNAIGQRLTELGAVLQSRAAGPAPRQTRVPQQQAMPQPPGVPQPAMLPQQQEAWAQQPYGMPPAPPPQAPQDPPYPAMPQPVQAARSPRRVSAGQLTTSRVLAVAGTAVTLLGVVFLLVLAAQQGWLLPQLRVGGGAALGATLVASAVWVHRKQAGRIGAYALAATGFTAVHLAVVAATSLYGYFPKPAGLGLGLLVAAAGLALADRWRAQSPAVGAVLGSAVCAPMITARPDAMLVGFLLVLQIAATPVQIRRGWRGLTLAAAVPCVLGALVAAVWTLVLPRHDGTTLLAVLAVSLLGVVLAAVTAGARRGDDVTAVGLLVASPAPALLSAPMVERVHAGLLAALVAAMLLAVWAVGRFLPAFRSLLPGRFTAVAGGAGAVAALQATVTFVDPSAWATALLCEALLLALGAFQLRSSGILLGALCFGVAGFLVSTVHEVPIAALLGLGRAQGVPGVLAGLLIAAVAVLVPAVAVRLGALSREPGGVWALPGVVLLYGSASTIMALVLIVRDDRTGFLTGHILITLSWVGAAIYLLLRGVRLTHLRVAGMVLIAVALAKLFLFDLATLDGFARVVAFLCAGLVLLAAGVRYARLVAAEQADG